MRPRATLALSALIVLAAPAAAAAPSDPPTTGKGLTWTLPAGRHDVDPRLNSLASPTPQLAAASFAVRRVRRDPDCRLDGVHAQVPRGGALVLRDVDWARVATTTFGFARD
jgi:hypothetical protein